MRRAVGALALIWMMQAAYAAAAPPPFKMGPPDMVTVVPLVSPALDKPALVASPMSYPPSPQPMPPLPGARVESDLALQPVAPASPPRFLACNPLGSVMGVVSELVECGRAKFQRGEFEEAREALETAVKRGSDAAVLREARYWLGETLIRLRRPEPAAQLMLQVMKPDARSDVGPYAALKYGWLSLLANEPTRALETLDTLVKSGLPPNWCRGCSSAEAWPFTASDATRGARRAGSPARPDPARSRRRRDHLLARRYAGPAR